MRKTFTTAIICYLLTSPLSAQLFVNTNLSAAAMVNSLVDNSINASNVTEDCSKNAINVGRGTFTSLGADLRMSEGILMTTGDAKLAIGPNLITSAGLGGLGLANGVTSDPDLQNIVGISNLFDLCKIEFDIVPSNDTLSISYVFGSEEYPEYAPPMDNSGTFNDVFGFFLSGPGYSGTVNFAVLPNGDRVSVNSINAVKNSNDLIDNTNGVNLQYDGITRELTSKIKVMPNQKYHVKLAIADVGDSYYDSGVFIKAGSMSALPIKLVSLEGMSNSGYNILEWTTASEINNQYVEVLKSDDGRNFFPLEKIIGSGNSYTSKTYSYEDENPLYGNNYYRLKQTDYNGKITYSQVINVRNYFSDISIAGVFPNPAEQYVNTVVKSASDTRVFAELTDFSGKSVLKNEYDLAKGSNSISMSTSDLRSGIYFLRVYNDQFTSQYQRIMK